MIKVLIVDDEILIRVGIKSCIDWESNGFEIVGLAEDGKQALEIVERVRPDIVLTDIRMPNMDGLELIELVKKRYPNIRSVVLSCYNELDYIKKAMKLGADDYILKLSMQPRELLDVLNKVKTAITDEKEAMAQSGIVKNEIRIDQSIIKEDLYRKLIDGAIPAEKLPMELRSMGSAMAYSKVGVVCAGIDDYSNASVRSKLMDRYLLKYSVINILEEILSGFCPGEVIETDKGEYLVIMDFSEADSDLKKLSGEYCLKVNNALKNYLNINVSFGISELTGSFSDFKAMYTQAAKALEQRFYYGRESIIFYDRSSELTDKSVLLDFSEEKLLVGSLENLDTEGAKAIVSKFFNVIKELRKYNPGRVKMAAIEIMHSFIKVAKKFEVEFEQITAEYGENPVDILMKAETISDICSWFEEMTEVFIDRLSNKKLSAVRPEILKLKQYISERIYEDITLEKAAKLTNMSKSYLSTIFKKETGEAYTDYVNRLKMEEAMELIQKFDLKTYEAAEKLGYNDESYFSKLFKKYNGINSSKVNKGNKE